MIDLLVAEPLLLLFLVAALGWPLATVFPTATVLKILLAQLLLTGLG